MIILIAWKLILQIRKLEEEFLEMDVYRWVLLFFFCFFFCVEVIFSPLWFQEEILFCIYPELLSAMILCEEMEDNEAVEIRGVQKYSSCVG